MQSAVAPGPREYLRPLTRLLSPVRQNPEIVTMFQHHGAYAQCREGNCRTRFARACYGASEQAEVLKWLDDIKVI